MEIITNVMVVAMVEEHLLDKKLLKILFLTMTTFLWFYAVTHLVKTIIVLLELQPIMHLDILLLK